MSLSVWQRNIVTESGDVIPDAEIEVFDAGSSSKPDLFSDSDGDSSLTNPFNADANGFARFYVAGGRYDIAVNGTVLWEDVALGTAQGRDTGTGDNEVPTNAEFGGPTPTEVGRGAIVESDTNDNGHYVRWENGEQVCWLRDKELDSWSSSTSKGPYAYPASFLERPSSSWSVDNQLTTSGRDNVHDIAFAGSGSDVDTGWILRNNSGATISSISINFFAWGFWK